MTARAIQYTSLAWSIPAAVGRYHPLAGFLASAALHPMNQQRQPLVEFPRALTAQEVGALGVAKYAAFVPSLALHVLAMEKATEGKGPLPFIEPLLQKPFKAVGGPVKDFPIGFVGPRALAQNGASAVGSVLAVQYLECQFGEKLKVAAAAPSGAGGFNPAGLVAGAAAFGPMGWLLLTGSGKAAMGCVHPGLRPYVMPALVPSLCVVSDVLNFEASKWWNDLEHAADSPAPLERISQPPPLPAEAQPPRLSPEVESAKKAS
jgi:hypothetical protein